MTGRRTFHLADMVFEPTTPQQFGEYCRRSFEDYGCTERTIWFARGMGYANLPVDIVDAIVILVASDFGKLLTPEMLAEQLLAAAKQGPIAWTI